MKIQGVEGLPAGLIEAEVQQGAKFVLYPRGQSTTTRPLRFGRRSRSTKKVDLPEPGPAAELGAHCADIELPAEPVPR